MFVRLRRTLFDQVPKFKMVSKLEDTKVSDKMRVVCISDTHTYHAKLVVPDGDILIHGG